MRLLLVLLVACKSEPSPDTDGPPRCGEAGEVTVVADGFAGTEGIAFSPDGRLFVSDLTRVVEVSEDGFAADIATFPHAIGLAWWGDRLMVASFDTGAGVGGVYSLDVDTGTSTVFAEGISQANFLAVTPWNTLLVSDDFDVNIYEVNEAGQVSIWLDNAQSPNGMAFSPDTSKLYYATTFGMAAPIWEVPLEGESAGTPVPLKIYDVGEVPDGMAMTESGNPLVALNIGGHIDEISADSATVLASDLDTPASLAFGEGSWDDCAVYATSLLGDSVYKVAVGQRGSTPLR